MKTSLQQNINSLMEQIIDVRYTELEKERESCHSLLELSVRENYLFGIAFAHTYLGDYYVAQNDTVKCGYHLQMAKPLCIENSYTDLLMLIYNLYGICYESLADEQTAFQYYLLALNLAEKHPNPSLECILFNNIANNFENFKDYKEAEKYYIRACSLFAQIPITLPNQRYIQLRIWENLSDVCRSQGRLEETAKYLTLCGKLNSKGIDFPKKILLYGGWCNLYAEKGLYNKAVEYARLLLEYTDANPQGDKYLTYETLINVCDTMIKLRKSELCGLILERLLKMLRDGESNRSLQIQRLKTKYYETFGSESEQQKAYREYYAAMEEINTNLNQVRATGLRNILYLDQINNNLLHEKNCLNEEAHLDELTKLYNRRYFNKMYSKTLSDPKSRTIGFIMIDIDYFKEYNDTYGHAKGDCVLKAVAKILEENAGENIIPSRYGGDEFVCLCINTTSDGIRDYLNKVQANLAALNMKHDKSCCSSIVTLSVGFSNKRRAYIKSPDLLFDEADKALYTSKNSGRNTATEYGHKKHRR